MPKEAQYTLSDVTVEEKESFMKEFQELLIKHSVYFEPVPQYARDSLESPWKIVCQIMLQKKTELVPKDSVQSPYVELKPTNEPTPEN